MGRGKTNTKSGWKKRDRKFRDEQNARARANREKKAQAQKEASSDETS